MRSKYRFVDLDDNMYICMYKKAVISRLLTYDEVKDIVGKLKMV